MNKAWKSLAALPLLACFLQAASPVVSELPLPEKIYPGLDAILRSAVQQSPRMVSRVLDLEMAENNRIIARSNLLPSMSGNYGINTSKDKYVSLNKTSPIPVVSDNNITKTPYSLSLSQPLFVWGERWNNDKIGGIRLKMAQGDYRQAYRLLAQELRGKYLNLIVQKLALKRARFNGGLIDNQLKTQEERLLKGGISEAEIAAVRIQAEQTQINLERSEYDYASAKQSFARLAGLGVIDDGAIPDAVAQTTYAAGPFNQLLADFLAQKEPVASEAIQLQQRIAIAKLDYKNAKTRLLPKVYAVMGLSQDEQSDIYGPGTKYTSSNRYAGITINWLIFDGFVAGAAKRNALILRRQLEGNYQLLTDQLAQDAQTAVKQINFTARNMAILDRQLVSSLGYLRTMQEDFRRGVKSEADVGQVQLSAYDTELTASSIRNEYLIRIGEFLGTLNEDPIVAYLPVK